MATALQQQLLDALADKRIIGQLKIDEPLSRYTTWRVGGRAECCYQPDSVEDLQALLKMLAEDVAINWIGLGSNVLIRDGGLNGVVINTNGVLNKLTMQCEPQNNSTVCTLNAEAGLACAIFSRKAAHQGLNGAEFLSGIPGTMGGALAMNAGAFGGETWAQVVGVDMINRKGEITHRTPDEFDIAYRQVKRKKATGQGEAQEWFVRGQFCYPQDKEGLEQSRAMIKQLLKKRADTQPTKQANAGSVFKNPQGDYAARLIEACGLKGKTIGGAQVSEKHANFIINTGNASASDIETLIQRVQDEVASQHGIKLDTEVRILGNAQ